MRVVGGEARGRPLRAPPGRATRPTSDKVRQAIFAILGSLPIGVGRPLEGATVTDLFAGSGALGIEALSRGAARVTFVDAAPPAVRAIRDNLCALGLTGLESAAFTRAQVVRADALRWLETAPPADLVLADPPYGFAGWPELAALLAPVAGLVVLESGSPLALGSGWEVVREKHYGGTVVLVAQPVRPLRDVGDQKGDT